MNYLLDTSVHTNLHLPGFLAAYGAAAERGELSVPTIVMMELLHSARNGREYDQRDADLRTVEVVPVIEADFTEAMRLQRALAHLSQPGRKLPDLLVAAVAIRLDRVVLHYDRDFERIANCSPLQHEWLIEPPD